MWLITLSLSGCLIAMTVVLRLMTINLIHFHEKNQHTKLFTKTTVKNADRTFGLAACFLVFFFSLLLLIFYGAVPLVVPIITSAAVGFYWSRQPKTVQSYEVDFPNLE